MIYISLFDSNQNSIPYQDILEKVSSSDDDIMLVGDYPSKYLSEGIDLGSLTRLLSLSCSKEIYLNHLDLNPEFDYNQLLESPCINAPLLLECISFSEERLSKEGLVFYKSIFDLIKEKDWGGGPLIAKISGGFSDESPNEYQETCAKLREYSFKNLCLCPCSLEKFDIVNFYSFKKFLEDDLRGIDYYEAPSINLN